ncbi:MAG: glycosyltransferase [Chitinophagaceae bacterium]|nr:glycosyltransferase [Chitinophagaceae bacterium]
MKRGVCTIIHQQNQGLATARNNGIEKANGKYILPLDADNFLAENFVDEAVSILDSDNNCSIVYSDRIDFNSEMMKIEHVGEFDINKMIRCNYIDACAIYRKTVWSGCGGYDKLMPFMGHEDWDLWVHAYFNKFRFYYYNKPGFYYRLLESSMIRTMKENDLVENQMYLLKKYSSHLPELFLKLSSDYTDVSGAHFWLKNYLKKNKLKSIVKILTGGFFQK